MPYCYHRNMAGAPRNNWAAFLRGMGSALALYPTNRRPCVRLRLHLTAEDALRSDWDKVGADLWAAFDAEVKTMPEAEAVGRR